MTGAPGDIAKVCVIGAGVMGAGIAAQIANGGVPVLLLDLVREGETDRDAVARAAIGRMLKIEPAPFMSPSAAARVQVGNIEDHLHRIAECDWVIEAIVERLEPKQALYRRIDAVRRPGTAVSSNTSTLPLSQLAGGMPDAFRRDFLITHFFNPPRYMRLMELVSGDDADPDLRARIEAFCDRRLGKTVVRAKDTPGFIANRIGTFWIRQAVGHAIAMGLSVEAADAVMGRPFGIPKTGVFGLLDLIGLDLMPHIDASLGAALPLDDAFHATPRAPSLVARMIADGYTGRKGKGGFYRRNAAAGRVKESIDLATGAYAPSVPVKLEGALARDPRALIASQDQMGRFAWAVMGPTLAYAAGLVPEVSDDIASVDAAMRLGFNWKMGPFELLDVLGPAAVADRLAREGGRAPPLLDQLGEGRFYAVTQGRRRAFALDGGYHDLARPPGVLTLADIKLAAEPLLRNGAATAWDIGDGVVCFEFTTKMNVLDEQTLKLLDRTLALVQAQFRALVIYSDAEVFSAGANLGQALFAANIAAWGEIERMIAAGQRTFKAMKYAPFPVVAAPAGLALGGGCEICLHADAIQAHAELYMGLVECGVGVIPGWGGCGEMLQRGRDAPGRAHGPMPAVMSAFETLSLAKVSKSAEAARALTFLRPADGVTMNRDRLLADAKARALALVDGYVPPPRPALALPGASGQAALRMAAQGVRRRGEASEHDLVVAMELAGVLTGGDADPPAPVAEAALLALEREAFLRLVKTPATLARVEHMLETGKPLRN